MTIHESLPLVTARRAARADARCFDAFCRTLASWETPAIERDPERRLVFERSSRIVGFSCARVANIEPLNWNAEPLPVAGPIASGPQRTLVGLGLWVANDASPTTARAIHRLARGLHADELGVRHAIVQAPVPAVGPYTGAEVVQQIASGAIEWTPITVPLQEGYWPVAITDHDVVLLREQRAF